MPKSQSMREPLDGLPLLVAGRFFVGVEHPMAVHAARDGVASATHWNGAVGDIKFLKKLRSPSRERPWQYGAVLGTFEEISQARRSFLGYLHRERPGRLTPMVHYNSWYDFYSYQDEGFNGGFKDPFKDEELISSLRPDTLSEKNCVQRVNAVGTELVRKRNTTVDSFLWDDGWDDPKTLWQMDKERFPNGFEAVSSTAKSYGVGTGVWLSPWGGYGYPLENRVKYGKQYGFETNTNELLEEEAFSLAGPKYRSAFTEVALRFVRESGVNMFKFDGVAGDPRELAVEMEAMLGLITDLRAATRPAEKGSKEAPGSEEDRIWINLTTGTWASPFFLFWADSIWRGGPDIANRRQDWLPDAKYWRGATEHGKLRGVPEDGLTQRQRWIRWRNVIVFVMVVQQSLMFPLSQLMIHGVIVASHGDALHWGLDKFNAIDFAQEVWSFVALGLQLQELYIAPRHMTPEGWDILSEGLRWARREAAVLRDSNWAFGDPTRREVYCVASWDVAAGRGFAMLHNPTGRLQETAAFQWAGVLELPSAQQARELSVATVKSIATGTMEEWSKRLSGASCSDGGSDSACLLKASEQLVLRMLPTEVLVLQLQLTPTAPEAPPEAPHLLPGGLLL